MDGHVHLSKGGSELVSRFFSETRLSILIVCGSSFMKLKFLQMVPNHTNMHGVREQFAVQVNSDEHVVKGAITRNHCNAPSEQLCRCVEKESGRTLTADELGQDCPCGRDIGMPGSMEVGGGLDDKFGSAL